MNMTKRPSGFKTQEEYNAYMREYREREKEKERLILEQARTLIKSINEGHDSLQLTFKAADQLEAVLKTPDLSLEMKKALLYLYHTVTNVAKFQSTIQTYQMNLLRSLLPKEEFEAEDGPHARLKMKVLEQSIQSDFDPSSVNSHWGLDSK
jgi:hypothetical protein